MTRRVKYSDSPKRKDYPDHRTYKLAYGKYLRSKGLIKPRVRKKVGKLPSERAPKRDRTKYTIERDRVGSAEAALIKKTKEHTAAMEAEIASSIEFIDWYGPDLDLDASSYLLENSLLDKNCF
jgi:hypothetical protein